MTTAAAPAASSARVALRTARPLITLGMTWLVRKGAMRGYEARTGKPAPVLYNREASMFSRVLWAAGMAGTIALVEVVLWQILGDDED
jgi:hypothetical protein